MHYCCLKKTYDCTTFMNHEIISNKLLQVIYFAVINSNPTQSALSPTQPHTRHNLTDLTPARRLKVVKQVSQ